MAVSSGHVRVEVYPPPVTLKRFDVRLLQLVGILLPFGFLPLEITQGVLYPLSGLSLLAILLLFIRLNRDLRRLDAVELAGLCLLLIILLRLLVVGPTEFGIRPNFFAAVDEVSQLLPGLLLYRVLRRVDATTLLMKPLIIALSLMIGWTFFQSAVGLGYLRSRGYVSPEFVYFTAQMDYRPFGSFRSPTNFAGFLAMFGLFVLLVSRSYLRSRTVAVLGFLTVVGLLLTETRGAWIAFALGLAAVHLKSSSMRSRTLRALPFAVLLAVLVIAAKPELVEPFVARASTITDSSYNSNSTRLDLWRGSSEVYLANPILGVGSANFQELVQPFVPIDITPFGHPHNSYLYYAFRYGTLGAAAFILLLFALGRRVRRGLSGDATKQVSLAAYGAFVALVANSFTELLWTNFNIVTTLFAIVGLSAGSQFANLQAINNRAIHRTLPTGSPMKDLLPNAGRRNSTSAND